VGHGHAAQEQRALTYLRDNLKYGLGQTEQAGLRRFHELAAEIGVVAGLEPLRFFEG
jgi:predicted solute-binding protein